MECCSYFLCLLALLIFVIVYRSRVEGDFLLFLYILDCSKQGDVNPCTFHKTGDVDSRNGKVIQCTGWGTSKVPSVHSGQPTLLAGQPPQRNALHVANYNLIGVSYTPV
jgi:hypothetical protein